MFSYRVERVLQGSREHLEIFAMLPPVQSRHGTQRKDRNVWANLRVSEDDMPLVNDRAELAELE